MTQTPASRPGTFQLGDSASDTVRLIMVNIPKSKLLVKDCPFCRDSHQKIHLHMDYLEKRPESDYWKLKLEFLTLYQNALIEALQNQWFRMKLEPADQVAFNDGKYRFTAVSLCFEKGKINRADRYGLTAPKITREQARAIMAREAAKWSFTPVDSQEQDNKTNPLILPGH